MDTDWYREFCLLAELTNYSEASEQLTLSSSSLSRHIKSLEEELGVTLFDRTSRTVKLNSFGQIFLSYARQFVYLQQCCTHDLIQAKDGATQKVVLGSLYYIDDLLSKFHTYDSEIAISILEFGENETQLTERLRMGICELIFAINLLDTEDEFVSIPYESDHYVAVMPPTHPLAKREKINLVELAKDHFISFNAGAFGDTNIRRMCKQAGFEPHIVYCAVVGSSIADLVRTGMGVSILQKNTLSKMHPHDLAVVDFSPPYSANVTLNYLKKAKLSSAAKRFVDYVANIWPTLKSS